MPWKPLLRMARAWLDDPTGAQLPSLIGAAREAEAAVPESRRDDWRTLVDGIARRAPDGEAEAEARTRARVEGLVRACKLFASPVSPLDPVDRLPGLGPTSKAALAESGLSTVTDLLWLAPVGFDDLRAPRGLGEAIDEARALGGRGERVALSVCVESATVVPVRGRRTVRLVVRDAEGEGPKLHVFWFFMAHGVLAVAKPGARILLLGRVLTEGKKPPRMAHPDIFVDAPEARFARARYPKVGATGAALRKGIAHALAAGLAPDPVPRDVALREAMPDASTVLREVHAVHRPLGAPPPPPSAEARRAFLERLAWGEAFTRAWERLSVEADREAARAPSLSRAPKAVARLEEALGFSFTAGQRSAIEEISRDLEGDRPMRRLLLGDVGTGKTAVALAAAAQCIEARHQVAILAPTSVLAEQYLLALAPLVRATAAKVALLAAGVPAAARRATEERLRTGALDVVVGTHALLREDVELARLGLVVVDEQQRLGVAQRLALVKKGSRPHLLTLSATPIPRTLALALRGELATTTLRERPRGRGAVATELAAAEEIAEMLRRVEAHRGRGERVFWVVPRIEETDDADDEDAAAVDPMASATQRFAALREALPDARIVLLHGAMKAEEKRDAMRAFRSGEADVLVGTTVIEVGVDVPEATLMVVEDAERFGLAQLHQLRGRVGRGARPGTCVLLHRTPLQELARRRLSALVALEDGEAVARADLELRGAGDLGGTRQHGVEEELVWLAPGDGYPWLDRVEADARAIRARDPALASEEHGVLASLVARLSHAIAVREEAG